MFTTQQFQYKVLCWYKRYGRKDLPWQMNVTPYRVWVSEIMLQQTQVKTVIPYFNRFMKRFPHIELLAQSHLDEVLHLWTGLGYYARARNLHHCANILIEQYRGIFPQNIKQLEALPGIGRSTAGAILSLGMNQSASILDGNIKRLFLRYHAIEGSIKKNDVLKESWQLAQKYTPKKQCSLYNQAMMDLGAIICTPRDPSCQICPLKEFCLAYRENRVAEFPYKTSRKILPVRSIRFLLIQNEAGEMLLEKRPSIGIWASLWCFPQCSMNANWKKICKQQYGCKVKSDHKLPIFRHTLTHLHFDIQPIIIQVEQIHTRVMENDRLFWYDLRSPVEKGIPQPVKYLLDTLRK